MPTEKEEAEDPGGADQHYIAATNFLLEKTRDKSKFPLVFAENVNYGYRRNLWGYRRYGILIAVVAAVCSWGIVFVSTDLGTWEAWSETVLKDPEPAVIIRMVGSIFNSAAIAFWVRVVTPEWVRVAADAYAQRLLASVESLEPTRSEIKSND